MNEMVDGTTTGRNLPSDPLPDYTDEWEATVDRLVKQVRLDRLMIMGCGVGILGLAFLVRTELKVIANLGQAINALYEARGTDLGSAVPAPKVKMTPRTEAPLDETVVADAPVAEPVTGSVSELSAEDQAALAQFDNLAAEGTEPFDG